MKQHDAEEVINSYKMQTNDIIDITESYDDYSGIDDLKQALQKN